MLSCSKKSYHRSKKYMKLQNGFSNTELITKYNFLLKQLTFVCSHAIFSLSNVTKISEGATHFDIIGERFLQKLFCNFILYFVSASFNTIIARATTTHKALFITLLCSKNILKPASAFATILHCLCAILNHVSCASALARFLIYLCYFLHIVYYSFNCFM